MGRSNGPPFFVCSAPLEGPASANLNPYGLWIEPVDFELTDAPAGKPPAAPASVDGITHFDFRHRVFRLPGAFLSPDHQGRPLLNVNLGDISAAMPEDSIKREFEIGPEDHDFKLISLTARALRHVPVVTPGDALPNEIVDGTASWPIEERHYEMARQRLLLKLAAWASNQEPVNVPPAAMVHLLESPEVQANLKKGTSEAADMLGLKGREQVVDLLENAGREMAYIEALREYFAWIVKIPKDIKQLQTLLKGDREIMESAIRSHQLAMPAIRRYRDMFLEIEALFAEIVHALGRLPAVIQIVRRVRDELHRETLLWAQMQDGWQVGGYTERSQAREAANLVYGFLAKNFLNVR
jgi:hypothetical protein